MWNIRKQSPTRSARRRRDRHVRRLGLEALEQRTCPAVMFELVQGDEGGILSIIGDSGRNVIEIAQRSDGVVEAMGDGEQHRFEGVREIVASTGDGDDLVQGKIILWVRDSAHLPGEVPFLLKLDTGAGDDTARIDDGGLITFRDLNDVRSQAEIHVNLGAGADNLRVALDNHLNVALDVLFTDGGDTIEAPIVLGSLWNGREPTSVRASLQLGGGDNDVDIQALGFGKADLSVDAAGGGNTIYIGSANGGVWKTTDGSSALMAIELGGGDNDVKLGLKGIEEVNLELHALGGSNTLEIVGDRDEQTSPQQLFFPGRLRVGAQFGGGDNDVDIRTAGFGLVDLNLAAQGGGNTVQFAGDDVLRVCDGVGACTFNSMRLYLEFGGGSNVIDVSTDNIDEVDTELRAAGGNNVVKHELGHTFGFRHEHTRPETTSDADSFIGRDDGFLQMVSISLPGGTAGDPDLYVKFGAKPTTSSSAVDAQIITGSADDTISVLTRNVDDLKLGINSGGGNDTVVVDAQANVPQRWFSEGPSPVNQPPVLGLVVDLGDGNNVLDVRTENLYEVDLAVVASGGNNRVASNQGWGKWEISPASTLPQNPTSRANIMLAGDENQVEFNTLGYENVDLDLGLIGNSNAVEIGLLLPAVQKVREAAARVQMTTGAGSLVDVRLENIDNVDLSLVSDPASPEPKPGGTIQVYYHVIRNGSRNVGRNDGVVILNSSLPGGSAAPRTPGDSLPTFSFAATAGAVAPTSVSAALNLGPEDDKVSFLSRNVDDLQLDFSTGDGDDIAKVIAKVNAIKSSEIPELKPSRVHYLFNLGDGNDSLTTESTGYVDVDDFTDAGNGNDVVMAKIEYPPLVFYIPDAREGDETLRPRPRLHETILLGPGDDRLGGNSVGYDVNSLVDAGDGDDEIRLKRRMLVTTHGIDLDRPQLDCVVLLGLGSDTLVLETFGYRQINTTVDTGPEEDGFDKVTAIHHSLSQTNQGRRVYRKLFDGGRDVFDGIAIGYEDEEPVVGDGTTVYWVFGVELPRS